MSDYSLKKQGEYCLFCGHNSMPDFNVIDGKHVRICMTCGNKQILHQLPKLEDPPIITSFVAKLLTHKNSTNTQCFANNIETCKNWARLILTNPDDKVIIYETTEKKVIELAAADFVEIPTDQPPA